MSSQECFLASNLVCWLLSHQSTCSGTMVGTHCSLLPAKALGALTLKPCLSHFKGQRQVLSLSPWGQRGAGWVAQARWHWGSNPTVRLKVEPALGLVELILCISPITTLDSEPFEEIHHFHLRLPWGTSFEPTFSPYCLCDRQEAVKHWGVCPRKSSDQIC